MTREDLIGTWRTTGHALVAKDGTVTHPFGPGPHPGNLVYHPNGTVSVLVIRTDPMRLSSVQAPQERGAALDRCVAYIGTWEVQGDTVQHHIQTSINPDWVGTTQVRTARLEGDTLTLSPPPDPHGTVARISWLRVSR